MASDFDTVIHVCGTVVQVQPTTEGPGGFAHPRERVICLLPPGHDGQCVTGTPAT